MGITEILILVAAGTIAGFLSGSLGIGGGLIVIPALVFVLGMSQKMAQGTNLAMMIPPIGIIAAYNYWKEGQVNIGYSVILIIAFMFGSYFGSILVIDLPDKLLKKFFGALLLIIGTKYIFS
jgi:uncharacterized membrane protein YfcA